MVGIDFAAALSNLLAYGLVSIGYAAESPVGSAGNLHQKILLLGSKNLLIAISFWPGPTRYCGYSNPGARQWGLEWILRKEQD